MNIQPISSGMVPTASPPTTSRSGGDTSGTSDGNVAAPGAPDVSAAAAVAAATPSTTTATVAASTTPSAQPTSKEALQKALDEVKQAIPPSAQDLLFSIDKDTGRTVVKVVDASTKKVLRQIPSEEIMAIAKSLDKFDKLQGLLVKQKV